MSNNIEEDIKIVEKCIVESISVPLDLDNIDVSNYRNAISNILKEYKKNQKIVDKIKSEIKRLEKEQAEEGEDYYDEYEYEIILLSNLLKED